MHSTRFKRSLVVLIFLAITALVSSSLYSFQTRGYVYDQLLEHNHSPAYADNGYDASFLQSSSGICSDCLISSCDYTAKDTRPRLGRGTTATSSRPSSIPMAPTANARRASWC